jgi:hypothetical protein
MQMYKKPNESLRYILKALHLAKSFEILNSNTKCNKLSIHQFTITFMRAQAIFYVLSSDRQEFSKILDVFRFSYLPTQCISYQLSSDVLCYQAVYSRI